MMMVPGPPSCREPAASSASPRKFWYRPPLSRWSFSYLVPPFRWSFSYLVPPFRWSFSGAQWRASVHFV